MDSFRKSRAVEGISDIFGDKEARKEMEMKGNKRRKEVKNGLDGICQPKVDRFGKTRAVESMSAIFGHLEQGRR